MQNNIHTRASLRAPLKVPHATHARILVSLTVVPHLKSIQLVKRIPLRQSFRELALKLSTEHYLLLQRVLQGSVRCRPRRESSQVKRGVVPVVVFVVVTAAPFTLAAASNALAYTLGHHSIAADA